MVQCAHLEKYELVNGKDDIPHIMENKKCSKMFQTTNQNKTHLLQTLHTTSHSPSMLSNMEDVGKSPQPSWVAGKVRSAKTRLTKVVAKRSHPNRLDTDWKSSYWMLIDVTYYVHSMFSKSLKPNFSYNFIQFPLVTSMLDARKVNHRLTPCQTVTPIFQRSQWVKSPLLVIYPLVN